MRLLLARMSTVSSRRDRPYMGYIGMCRCEGYGFQAVYSSIGYSKIQLNYPKMAAEVTKLGYIARVFFPSRLLVRINVFLS